MNIFSGTLSNAINTISGGGSNNNNSYSSPIDLVTPILQSNSLGNYSNYGNFVGGPIPSLSTASDVITPLIDTTTPIINTATATASNIVNPISNTANNA
jgi:hypothetical protein